MKDEITSLPLQSVAVHQKYFKIQIISIHHDCMFCLNNFGKLKNLMKVQTHKCFCVCL